MNPSTDLQLSGGFPSRLALNESIQAFEKVSLLTASRALIAPGRAQSTQQHCRGRAKLFPLSTRSREDGDQQTLPRFIQETVRHWSKWQPLSTSNNLPKCKVWQRHSSIFYRIGETSK